MNKKETLEVLGIISESSIEVRIKQATKEVEEAMIENVLSGRAEVDAKIRKQKAHYNLQQANERLNSLRSELMDFEIK